MTYWEGYRDGSRDKEGVIRELGDANERLTAALQAALDWHDGRRHDGEWVGMARRALEQARKE